MIWIIKTTTLIIIWVLFIGCTNNNNQNNEKTHTSPGNDLKDSYADLNRWQLTWNDEFNGSSLSEDWSVEHGDGVTSHILSNRWITNVTLADGSLRLINKKEETTGIGSSDSRRNTHQYTSGNIWTKEQYKYGYYECRFKYSNSHAINNAFWFMSSSNPDSGVYYEIDVNEGHYPNEINMNLHNRDIIVDGSHKIYPLAVSYGTQVGYSFQLERER